jgi:hypothetical protein
MALAAIVLGLTPNDAPDREQFWQFLPQTAIADAQKFANFAPIKAKIVTHQRTFGHQRHEEHLCSPSLP